MGFHKRLMTKIKEMGIELEAGLTHITVVHQDRCPALKGGKCRCDFEVKAGMPPQLARQAKNAAQN